MKEEKLRSIPKLPDECLELNALSYPDYIKILMMSEIEKLGLKPNKITLVSTPSNTDNFWHKMASENYKAPIWRTQL